MLNIIYSGKNVPCHHKPARATSLSGCQAAEFGQLLCWTRCGLAGPSVLPAAVGTILLPRVQGAAGGSGAAWGSQICPALRHCHKTQMRQNSGKNHVQTEKQPSGNHPSSWPHLGLVLEPFPPDTARYSAGLESSLPGDPSNGPGDPVSSFCPLLPVRPHRRGPLVVIYTVVRMSSFTVLPLAVECGTGVFIEPGNPLA